MPQEPSRLTLPSEVQDAEFDYIEQRRKAAHLTPSEDGELPLVGIALSGGGIRSATFSLGVLQTLAGHGVLRLTDYLSTVSGGGYIGSCLTSLMTQKEGDQPTVPPPDLSENMPLLERKHLHHLRKHGDFLLLSSGVLRREVIRSVGGLILGISATLLMYVLLQVILSSYLIAQTTVFAGGDFWSGMLAERKSEPVVLRGESQLRGGGAESLEVNLQASMKGAITKGNWPGLRNIWRRLWGVSNGNQRPLLFLLAWGGFVSVVAGSLIAREAIAEPHGRKHSSTGETTLDRQQRNQLWRYASVHVILGVLLPLAYAIACPPSRFGTAEVPSLAGLLFHPAYFAGALIAASCHFVWNAFWGGRRWDKRRRSLFGGFYGISLYGLTFSVAVVAMIILVWWAVSGGMWTWLAGSSVLSMILTRILARRNVSRDGDSSLTEFLAAVATHIGLILSVFVFFALTLVLCSNALIVAGINDGVRGAICLVIATVLFVIFGFVINMNRVSLHYFYRDRLSEAYLQTEDNVGFGLEIVRDDTGLKLTELGDQPNGDSPCPYHLIMCALNLAGSRDLSRRDRKSDHFLFSRYFCGSTTTGYVRTEVYRGGKTELQTAMTISGAAFSSAMGFRTSLAQAFATTLFNLRLGYWMVNPRVYDTGKHQVAAEDGEGTKAEESAGQSSPSGQDYFCSSVNKPAPAAEKQNWNDVSGGTELLRRCSVGHMARDSKKVTDEGLVFWPYFLFLEMAAMTHSDSTLINLSDGGHTGDNIGLYSLFQRRCKLIIACDGEDDPDYSFRSLASAIRQIYVDENVKVMIELDKLIPAKKGDLAQQFFLIGKIEYPDGPPGDANSVGWLIYLKSSLASKELPIAVKSYAETHPRFPHETTIDQIFTDDQFEAYRMLGGHIAGTALDALRGKDKQGSVAERGTETAKQFMERCESWWNDQGK